MHSWIRTNRRAFGKGRFWVLLVAASFAACTAGSGEGLDISGRPVGEGGDVPLAPTLESLQANLFNPFCTVCHSGAAAPLGLRLDEGNSFSHLVGVRSRQTSLFRVEPGSPERSYLIRKLEGTAGVGGQMPLSGPPLPQATIDFARQWILDGAAPASGDADGLAPVVVSVDPAPGASLPVLPAQVEIGFGQDMDAATINAMTFTLVRSGGDGQFDDGNDIAVMPDIVSLSMVSPRLATMDLGSTQSVDDEYRITLHGSGPGLVMGVDGLVLDGEFSGALPSGDGTEGGDFVTTFTVQGLQPTLQSIQTGIFGPTCSVSGCHSGPTGTTLPTGVDLRTADSSFAALVNVASVQVPSLDRVIPGDPDNSYLIQKLEGTASVGTRMPQGGPFLDPATLAVIRSWIETGALR